MAKLKLTVACEINIGRYLMGRRVESLDALFADTDLGDAGGGAENI